MMKIAHVVRQFYPVKGGLEEYVFNLAKEQAKAANNVHVFTLNRNFQNNTKLKKKEIVYNINISRSDYYGLKKYPLTFMPINELNKFDIIHIHGLDFFIDFLSLLKRFKIIKSKLIFTTHGLIFHTNRKAIYKKLYFYLISKFSLKKIDKIISISENDKKYISTLKLNSYLVPNGVKFQKFGQKIDRSINNNRFICFGRIYSHKNINWLIKTFSEKEYSKYELQIICPYENEEFYKIKNTIQTNNILISANISDEQILNEISKSNFIISASEYEGFGISIIEMMSYGLIPILHEKVISFKKFVSESKSGATFELNSHDLVNKISNFTKKNFLEHRENSINFAKKYSWEDINLQIFTLYKNS